jgi:alkylation response protein AidB-like acyl-CoA dehydrogenase
MISDAGMTIKQPLHETIVRHRGTLDPAMRERVARIDMRERALELTLERASQAGVSHLASALKVAGSKLRQDRAELIVDALGLESLLEDEANDTASEKTDIGAWLRSRSATIEGGTTEINLNVIAKRILQLPDPK